MNYFSSKRFPLRSISMVTKMPVCRQINPMARQRMTNDHLGTSIQAVTSTSLAEYIGIGLYIGPYT